MNPPDKIQSRHHERQAYIYIRQSTWRQVEENLESQALQYQLVQRAQALGWAERQIVVVDDDLGRSAITTQNRPGFQALVTAVGLSQVGIILVTDVSRLARNCSDWYQLLDLAAWSGTLIGDPQAIYEPRQYNDRLLLGLKGTFSEAQWHHMRQQLQAAQLNKAQRGELVFWLPVGYERTKEGDIVMTPDQEVQQAIRLVFSLFDSLGSAYAVLRALRERQLQLPRQLLAGPDRGTIEWVKPSYQAIHRMLKQPAYAGTYVFGKSKMIRHPGDVTQVKRRFLPLEEWAVVRQQAFAGYITWAQFLHNQEVLQANQQGIPRKGSPRNGSALLQGIVWCGRCGRRVGARYGNTPTYVCFRAMNMYAEPTCQHFMVPHIDEAVTAVFLEAVQPAHLETALAALGQIETQRQQFASQWQQRLERAGYEADLARRRYEQVDAANRLVAGELERRWEAKLVEEQQLRQEWVQVQAQQLRPLSEADRALIRQLANDVPALWHAATTTQAERKRLLRCLIQDVILEIATPEFSRISIRWHTGATTVVLAERPKAGRRISPEMLARISQLAQQYPDDRIADILNEEGLPTTMGMRWNRERVAGMRKQHQIPTRCPYYTASAGPRGDGFIATKEAAERLGVSPELITRWFQQGLLLGHQRRRKAALWVRLTDEEIQRFNGSAQLSDDLVPLTDVQRVWQWTPEQIRAQVAAGGLIPYRLRTKSGWRWYLQPAETTPSNAG